MYLCYALLWNGWEVTGEHLGNVRDIWKAKIGTIRRIRVRLERVEYVWTDRRGEARGERSKKERRELWQGGKNVRERTREKGVND